MIILWERWRKHWRESR